MNISIKKFSLLVLIVPASLHWVWMCMLGFLMFSRRVFQDVVSAVLIAAIVVAVFTLLYSIVSVFRYPTIKKASLYVAGLGCLMLSFKLYYGLYLQPLLVLSTISFYLGSAFLTFEYFKDRKPNKTPLYEKASHLKTG